MEDKKKRYKLYRQLLQLLLVIGIVVDTMRSVWFNNIPSGVTVPFFFLSLGLYLGFLICEYEVKRINEEKNR